MRASGLVRILKKQTLNTAENGAGESYSSDGCLFKLAFFSLDFQVHFLSLESL